MENIPFKTTDTLALWQWLILIFSCLGLVLAAVAAKWYAVRKKGKGGSLFDALTEGGRSDLLAQAKLQQRTMSRHSTLYHIEINGKSHLIFETEKGLIELNHEQIREE